MADFLLELFGEEIPARMQEGAARHLQFAFAEELKQAGLALDAVRAFATPRRIALLASGIPAMQPDVTLEKKGPKTSAPQAALEGFLRKEGLTQAQLEKRMVGKDEVYFATVHQKGLPSSTLLKTIIEKILARFPWPKSMRWGSGETAWVRPLQAITCLLDEAIVPVEFAGIAAGNVTYGHRFLAPQAITLSKPSMYEQALLDAKVIADAAKRKAEILRQAESLATQHGLTLKSDEGLLNEVTGLVEYPNLLAGTIDAAFMDLPPEVLVSEMRAHQKYFALLDKQGKLAPKFIITSNMITEDAGKAIIAGNERVLRARLADGRFFFDQDRKKTLAEWAKGLTNVTFHAKIGSIADKVERIKKLTNRLSNALYEQDTPTYNHSQEAAHLCKADLVTGMVGEFPELQGIMGAYYAAHQKEDATVAQAIREHYLPLGPNSPVPTTPVSICVALADKLDTLKEMFAAGEKPTGSKDPFALRRAALGVIRIILENRLEKLLLSKFVNDELLAFFRERLIVVLREKGFKHDIINAIMANSACKDDLFYLAECVKNLQAFLGTDDGKNLLAAYKRAVNILAIEEKKDNALYNGDNVQGQPLPAEQALLELTSPSPRYMANPYSPVSFSEVLSHVAALRKPIDEFFQLLINDPDPVVRSGRLNILARIRAIFNTIADFSLIEG